MALGSVPEMYDWGNLISSLPGVLGSSLRHGEGLRAPFLLCTRSHTESTQPMREPLAKITRTLTQGYVGTGR
jgi:hypothetical protein